MRRIKFDINKREQIESGDVKVVDGFGEEVSIIKWDAPSEKFPIIVMRSTGIVDNYSIDGKCMLKDVCDIYIQTDEPDYSPFEMTVDEVFKSLGLHHVAEETVYVSASKLLEAAKKEFETPHKEEDVIEALKKLNLRILEIAEEKHGKEKRYWEQSWRLTNTAINSVVEKEILNC